MGEAMCPEAEVGVQPQAKDTRVARYPLKLGEAGKDPLQCL